MVLEKEVRRGVLEKGIMGRKFFISFLVLLVVVLIVLVANSIFANSFSRPEGQAQPAAEAEELAEHLVDERIAQAREKMVSEHLVARGISDEKVLGAMRSVPRHLFVGEDLKYRAYEDNPLPIGEGQTISQPYIVALMTEALGLEGDEVVLEIGTGSGYQAAVLSELVGELYTVEIRPSLAARAEETLRSLG